MVIKYSVWAEEGRDTHSVLLEVIALPYRYIVGIVFGAEHLLLLVALFLQWAISPVPKSVRIAISRRKYHAKQQMLLPEGKKTK